MIELLTCHVRSTTMNNELKDGVARLLPGRWKSCFKYGQWNLFPSVLDSIIVVIDKSKSLWLLGTPGECENVKTTGLAFRLALVKGEYAE